MLVNIACQGQKIKDGMGCNAPPHPTSTTSMPASGFKEGETETGRCSRIFFSMADRMYARRVGFKRCKGAADPFGCHHFAA